MCYMPFLLGGQHLKDLNDPIMSQALVETENMLARGRMDHLLVYALQLLGEMTYYCNSC